MAIFAVFALCDYKRGKKRGRATDSVIPLRGLPCLSYDCYFISRFFLVNRDPHGKIEKFTFMGPVKFPINRILIHLGPNPVVIRHLGCRPESSQRVSTSVLSLGASNLKPEMAIESISPIKIGPKNHLSGLTPPRVRGLGPFSASTNTLASTNYHTNISPKALLL